MPKTSGKGFFNPSRRVLFVIAALLVAIGMFILSASNDRRIDAAIKTILQSGGRVSLIYRPQKQMLIGIPVDAERADEYVESHGISMTQLQVSVVDLEGVEFSSEVVTALTTLADLQGFNYLQLDGSECSDAVWHSLSHVQGLERLSIDAKLGSSCNLRGIRGLRHLEELNIYEGHLSADSCRGIAMLSKLKHLTLLGISAAPEALSELSRLSSLKTLMLWPKSPESIYQSDGVGFVDELDNLETLEISGCTIHEEDLGSIARLLRLRKLELRGMAISDEWLTALDSSESLRQLTIMDATISDVGLDCLCSIRGLEELALFRTRVTGKVPGSLSRLSELRGFCCRDSPVSDSALVQLYSLKKLEQIILVNTKVTEDGVRGLRQAQPNVTVEYE